MGFFKIKKIKQIKKKTNRIIKNPCSVCKLHTKCNSPKIEVSGNGKKKILIISPFPSKIEDEKGLHWVGESGKLLKKYLKKHKISLRNDCWSDYAIACHTKKPTNRQITLCKQRLLNNIKELKPEKIILFGIESLKSLINHKFEKIGAINKWVGFQIPDQEYKTWLYPIWHPSLIIQQGEYNKALSNLFSLYLDNAVNNNQDFPDYSDDEEKIILCEDVKQAIVYLQGFAQSENIVAFDYETSGLKPHKKGHKIHCIALSNNKDQAIAFPMFKNKAFREVLKKILTDYRIKKTAHNIKFENSWTKRILGYDVNNWAWDSMIAAHVLDNRTSTSLKFQTYVRYGQAGYDSDVQPFIKGVDEKDSNSFNKMNEFPIKKMLMYCGLDALYNYRLTDDQIRERTQLEQDKKPVEGFSLFHDGIKELMHIENTGIKIDVDYFERKNKVLKRKTNKLKEKILNSKEAHLWKKIKKKEFEFTSNTQIGELIYTILDIKPTKLTKTGKGSTDEDAFTKINLPFLKSILKYRKIEKLRSTYIKGFLREAVNGIIYPFTNLHIPKTFRSSMSNPNLQNIPKRDKTAQKLVRQGIIPRKGFMLLEADYSGAEVACSVCYHKDKNMLKYLEDPTTDMHRDVAMDLFLLTKKQMTKEIRFGAKNCFVFAQFYGDYYVTCAKNLWEYIENVKTSENKTIKDHLKKKKIKRYKQFENHIKQVEKDFWENRFKKYGQWKKRIWKKYQNNCYVDLLSGFRCTEYMKRNEAVNRGIQGFAFHFLLWSLIQINKKLRKEKWKSKIIFEIHDAIIMEVHPDELNKLIPMLRKIMCEDIKKYWPSIIVPLEIEIDITEINGNWYSIKPIKEM